MIEKLWVKFCFLLVVFGACAGPAIGQVTARQGVPSSQIQHFDSPMVLELPLPDLGKVQPSARVPLRGTEDFVCDGHVSIQDLFVGREYKGRKKRRSLEMVVSGTVVVEESYDRLVDIAFRLQSGSRELASQVLADLEVEEERTVPFEVAIPVDEKDMLEALAADPSAVLELELTVRSDK